MTEQEAAAIGAAIQSGMRDAALASAGNFVAKVAAGSGGRGYLRLVTPDGRTLRGVHNATGMNCQPGRYLTITRTADGKLQAINEGAAQSE